MHLHRRFGALLTVLAVIGSSALVGAAGAVAVAPPVLDTVSVSATQVTTPGSVTVSYTAHAEVPITQVLAGYTDEGGRAYSVFLSPGDTGAGVLRLPDGVRNGLWQLQYVYLTTGGTAPDPPTYVCRTGRVNTGCTEFRDFSAYDFTVSGSTWDVAAPVVSAVSLTPKPVAAGSQVTVSFVADEAHPVTRFSLSLINPAPEARDHAMSLASANVADLADGRFAVTVPASAYDGDYVAAALTVEDSVGNRAIYNRDGRVSLSGGATAPTSHSLDFATIGLEVTGSTRDVQPPVLESVTPVPATVPVGTPTTINYRTSDAGGSIKPRFCYLDPHEVERCVAPAAPEGSPFGTFPSVPLVGSLPINFTYSIGLYRLSRVALLDSQNNPIEYRRDGTTYNSLTEVTGTHTVDFAGSDISVVPTQVYGLIVRPRPQGASVRWSPIRNEFSDVTGYRVAINPGGKVLTVPQPADPTADLGIVVPGLTNGSTYTVTVTPLTAVGDGTSMSRSVTPMMSTNVFGVGGAQRSYPRTDLNQDGRADLLALARGYDDRIYGYLGTGIGGFTPGRRLVDAQLFQVRIAPGGNLVENGYPGVLVVTPEGELGHSTTSPGNIPLYRHVVGRGWGSMRFLDGGSDFTGDGFTDVVAVNAAGDLYLYRGNGKQRLTSGQRIGTGWKKMNAVFTPGDLSGDRKPDVVAVDATGGLWLYRGNGRGGLGAGTKIGSGWAGFGAVFAARDFNGDGRVDIAAITMAGDLLLYPGRGNGTVASGRKIGTGWSAFF